MLTWNVTYHCKPGRREAFYQAVTDLGVEVVVVLNVAGLAEGVGPDALLLVETWETPELQQAHCQTELFAKLQALKADYCASVAIDKFNY